MAPRRQWWEDLPVSENVEDRRTRGDEGWMQTDRRQRRQLRIEAQALSADERQLAGTVNRSRKGDRTMDPDLITQLMGGSSQMFDPALGSVLASNPEAIIPQLAASGIAPPTQPPVVAEGGPAAQSNPMAQSPLAAPSDPGGGWITPGSPIDRARQWWQGRQQGTEGQEQPANITGAMNVGPDPSQMGPGGPMPTGPVPVPPPRPTGMPMAGSPLDIRSQAQKAGESAPPMAAQPDQANSLQKALQGVKAPPAPQVQRISSPSVPRPNAIPNNPAIQQLLLAAAGGNAGFNPLYLGGALGKVPR
jgi:hypothetical protein